MTMDDHGIESDTMRLMDASTVLRRVRSKSGLSLRQLAERAGTSHATISAYETGRTVPSVATLDRIVRAAGYALGASVTATVGGASNDDRGRELVEVLELAAMFPARHARTLEMPLFGR